MLSDRIPRSSNLAWVVSLQSHLSPSGGGVQLCTQEYLATIRSSGLEPVAKAFGVDRRLMASFWRRFRPRPFRWHVPTSFVRSLSQAYALEHPAVVFFNQVDTGPAAVALRPLLPPECLFVLLSHGAKVIDEFHELRRYGIPSGAARRSERKLGEILAAEARLRSSFNHVFTLSEEEVAIEKWIGAEATYLPRTVTAAPLEWNPSPGRVGWVGTLDHFPNAHGLHAMLRAWPQQSRARLRVVGGPEAVGRHLEAQHPAVEYLGMLSDEGLRLEAASWSCFLHPLFLFARGCSTKLATAFGWEIPILTTPSGRRGYQWSEGEVPVATTPSEFAMRAQEMANPLVSSPWRARVQAAARSQPTLSDVGNIFRAALSRLRSVSPEAD